MTTHAHNDRNRGSLLLFHPPLWNSLTDGCRYQQWAMHRNTKSHWLRIGSSRLSDHMLMLSLRSSQFHCLSGKVPTAEETGSITQNITGTFLSCKLITSQEWSGKWYDQYGCCDGLPEANPHTWITRLFPKAVLLSHSESTPLGNSAFSSWAPTRCKQFHLVFYPFDLETHIQLSTECSWSPAPWVSCMHKTHHIGTAVQKSP